ncbi:MAG TPA: hypothetical protein VJK51_03155 [Candidatus Nanoarchaeia archaeon]|nr:hypothetical protein [Candidatus Nanoarchaeia archaeon]
MASKTKTREITIIDEGGTFNTFFKRFTGDTSSYDFEGLATLRKLLSNEKARIIHTIKTKNPVSVYQLATLVQRDFKAVYADVKLLERFGLIEFIAEKTGKRERLRPVVVVETLHINLKF